MGIKGDKETAGSALTAEYITDKLSPLGKITSKKMFGGHGIFYEGKMFCIVDSQGGAFLKADDSNRADFEQSGSEQHSRMPYYSIPDNVLEEQDQLIAWSKKSIAIQK